MKPKLNSSVSVVRISDNILEFFKSNTREQCRIRIKDDTILNIVNSLDGEKTIQNISEEFQVKEEDLYNLLNFLKEKGLLDNIEPKKDFEKYDIFRRPINFLADFSSSHEDLLSMWNSIRNSTVLVVGLGAVGSWTSCNLVQSGIKNLILMDGDIVDASNLHRQFGFDESTIGKYKTEALEKRLKTYADDIKVIKVNEFLNQNNLSALNDKKIDLIINCADKPNVDITSLWIGEYAMKRGIPHIVGGGYNLHLSLIGQTVIPGETACIKCFQKTLEEENKIDKNRVKKLAVKNRKVGSFGPMCSIIASMIGMESIKVLTHKIKPANINRRGEFDIYTMDITYKEYPKRKDCEWCGDYGIYRGKRCV